MARIYTHGRDIFSSLKLVSKPEETLLLKEDGSSNADDPMLRASLELRYQLEQVDKSSVPYFEIFSQKLNYRQQIFSEEASMIPIFSYHGYGVGTIHTRV